MLFLNYFKTLFGLNLKKIDAVTYEDSSIKAIKVDGFPTMIQAGGSTIAVFDDVVIDNPRLRKLSETDDEYNERMRLLDEQENKCYKEYSK